MQFIDLNYNCSNELNQHSSITIRLSGINVLKPFRDNNPLIINKCNPSI